MRKQLLLLGLSSMLVADSEVGCSISGLLHASSNSLLETPQESNCSKSKSKSEKENLPLIGTTTAITLKLNSVKVLHEQDEVLIERKLLNEHLMCPPFCIEPIHIKGVTTLGELEVLDFIEKLKEKKGRLLIDVRENKLYDKETIPGAINLPFSMLKNGSKYQAEVLRLLGAKQKNSKEKWTFKRAQRLLIFGASATTPEASKSLKTLLELGYPSSKLYYYRGGVSSWKALGLTTY